MREIKFRAWFENTIIKPMDLQKMIHQKVNEIPLKVLREEVVFMQFTGLKDKNGVEIYEGDIVIVKYHDFNPAIWYGDKEKEQNKKGVIGYCCEKACFDITINETNEVFTFIDEIEIEVIGNIYEDKELLK